MLLIATVAVASMLILSRGQAKIVNVVPFKHEDGGGIYFEHVNAVNFVSDTWHFVIEVDHNYLFGKVHNVFNEAESLIRVAGSTEMNSCHNREVVKMDVHLHIMEKCKVLQKYHRDIESKVKMIDEFINDPAPDLITKAPLFESARRSRRSVSDASRVQRRRKRGAFDFVGKVDNYLFGVMDSDDAAELHRVAIGENSINSQVKNLTSAVIEMADNIDKRLRCIEQARDLDKCNYLEKKYQALKDELVEIEKSYDKLNTAIDFAKGNRLSTYVITPETLMFAMANVTSKLPPDTSWPVETKLKQMHTLIDNVMNTHVFVTTNRKLLFILEVPLIKTASYNLFEAISVPMCGGDGRGRHGKVVENICAIVLPSSRYIGISNDKHTYIRMDDTLSCRQTEDRMLCFKPHTIYITAETALCDIRIMMKENVSTYDNCDVRVGRFNDEIFHPIADYNRWLYMVRVPTELNMLCSSLLDEDSTIVLPAGVGVISGDGSQSCELATKRSTISVHKLKSDLMSTIRINFTASLYDLNEAIETAKRIMLDGTKSSSSSSSSNNLNRDSLKSVTIRLNELRKQMNNNTIFTGKEIGEGDDNDNGWFDAFDFGFWKDVKIILYCAIVVAIAVVAFKVYAFCGGCNTSRTKTTTIIRNNYDREMVYLKGDKSEPSAPPPSARKLYDEHAF
ncbi:hypothetical protein SlsnVgp128 [Spodoptera littoralis nucleopolyhedrovirus]|uniref:Uncharacterized protein n=1 Tax=Spodoptera littoralis nuclear polyhedrosis virus TaxID=10456 RepID=M1JP08_NPVSL|nr:hypothetical protein SlsnVgp128 [Spodoptera littoralis nucleopolyhedrovirus]AGE89983.1 hypothetical protein SlsnVgp128 [Spodoptera littoralis nucleopolyhedrovirus]